MVDIDIEPEVEELEDGGIAVIFGQDEEAAEPKPYDHYENLALSLPDQLLTTIAVDVIQGVTDDLMSRADWEGTIKQAYDLLGLKAETGTAPFAGACMAVHPLLLENVVKFQGKASQALLPPGGPVKTRIFGKGSEELELKAQRVREYMNYQLTMQIPEYYDETERMLFHAAFAGIAFKKFYYNPAEQRPCNIFLRADELVVSAYAPDLRKAERVTHIINKSPVEFAKDVANGLYAAVELGQPGFTEPSTSADKAGRVQGVNQPAVSANSYTFYEQHRLLDHAELADADGTALPYVVTVDKDTQKVLAVRRNWRQKDPTKRKSSMFVKYGMVPTDTFYDIGYAHMLGNITRTVTAAMRSLVDAGQFANLQAGFKLKGMKIAGGNTALHPGEWRDVEVPATTDITKTIMPIPYKEPSQYLLEMMNTLIAAGQKFADQADQVVADSTNYGAVGTTLALLEASTKFYSSIHKRLHKSQMEELQILREINEEYIPEEGYPYDVVGAQRQIARQDFAPNIDVVPVTDPNIVSQSHRVAMSQIVLQLVEKAPQLHDVKQVLRDFYTTLGIDNVEKILPEPQPPPQQDPISDIMTAVQGKAIGAYPGQEHDAHIKVKSAWIQDPMNGGSPLMQQAAGVIAANIREHMVLKYQEQVGGLMKQAGAPPEAMEQIMAEAAQKIQQTNALLFDAQQQTQGMTPPEVAVKMKELALKAQDIQTKRDIAETTLAIRNKQLDVQRDNLNLKASIEGVKIGSKTKADVVEANRKVADTALKSLLQEKDIESNERITAMQMNETRRMNDEKIKLEREKIKAQKANAKAARKPAKKAGS